MFKKVKITEITYAEVSNALRSLGFTMQPKTATSHEKWVGYKDGKKYVVTVDKPQAPYRDFLIKSMAEQAGMSRIEFCHLCKNYINAEKLPHCIVTSDPLN